MKQVDFPILWNVLLFLFAAIVLVRTIPASPLFVDPDLLSRAQVVGAADPMQV